MADVGRQGYVDHYGAQYGNFSNELLAEVRREAFGEDIGQTGWLTTSEQDMFIEWLALSPGKRLLDVACGSGQPTLRIAQVTGCQVFGIDLHADAIRNARRFADQLGVAKHAEFRVGDGAKPLPCGNDEFDGLICIDAINHLADRPAVLADWHRVLRPGGRLVFTDPIVITGPLTNEEIATRASIGVYLFVPKGTDERMLETAGFTLEHVEDRTDNMAQNARGWLDARKRHEAGLRQIEGDKEYDGQQVFFENAARLAEERRLSRFAFFARKAG